MSRHYSGATFMSFASYLHLQMYPVIPLVLIGHLQIFLHLVSYVLLYCIFILSYHALVVLYHNITVIH